MGRENQFGGLKGSLVKFNTPVNTINSANFGQSISAFRARVIQFAGRFDF